MPAHLCARSLRVRSSEPARRPTYAAAQMRRALPARYRHLCPFAVCRLEELDELSDPHGRHILLQFGVIRNHDQSGEEVAPGDKAIGTPAGAWRYRRLACKLRH